MRRSSSLACGVLLAATAAACGGGDDNVSQAPPLGRVAIEAWLADGDYKSWNCEPTVHEARSPSPHGYNRICSNDVIASQATATGEWPEGAAAVKELYASPTGPVIGHAVYLKLASASAGGANWYWYETVPLDSPAPHDENGVVADGRGDSGPALAICVGCHIGAGSDAEHTPSPGGRDQVYTPVK